jgi:hypothetical protein
VWSIRLAEKPIKTKKWYARWAYGAERYHVFLVLRDELVGENVEELHLWCRSRNGEFPRSPLRKLGEILVDVASVAGCAGLMRRILLAIGFAPYLLYLKVECGPPVRVHSALMLFDPLFSGDEAAVRARWQLGVGCAAALNALNVPYEPMSRGSIPLNCRSGMQYILDMIGVSGNVSRLPGTMGRPFRRLSFPDFSIS